MHLEKPGLSAPVSRHTRLAWSLWAPYPQASGTKRLLSMRMRLRLVPAIFPERGSTILTRVRPRSPARPVECRRERMTNRLQHPAIGMASPELPASSHGTRAWGVPDTTSSPAGTTELLPMAARHVAGGTISVPYFARCARSIDEPRMGLAVPKASIAVPVMALLSSEARYRTTDAISSGGIA